MESEAKVKKFFSWRRVAVVLCMAGFILGFLCMFTTGGDGQLTWVNIAGVAMLTVFGRAAARLIGKDDEGRV